MPATKLKKAHFAGGANVNDGVLAKALRGLAIDFARQKFDAVTFTAPTDNGGGTNNAGGVPALAVPAVNFDASAAGGVTVTSLNTAILTHTAAQTEISTYLNTLRAPLGLPALTGTLATGGTATIAAITAAGTGGTGNATPTRVSVAASFSAIRNNWATLARAANQVAAALDAARLTDSTGGNASQKLALVNVPVTVASADGKNSVAKTTIDAFLAASKNGAKTLTTYLFALDDTAVDALRVVAAD